MLCMGNSNASPMDVSSGHWHTKPTEEKTLLFPQRFDSSAGLDQPSEPVSVSCNHCFVLSGGGCPIGFEWCVGYGSGDG